MYEMRHRKNGEADVVRFEAVTRVVIVLTLTAVLLAITGGVVYGEVPAAAQIMQPAG